MRFYYTKVATTFKNIPLFALILVLLSCSQKEPDVYRVIEINDGDTITASVSSAFKIPLKTEKIRLIGIDAPELAQKPWGLKAKNHLKKLIEESNYYVKIECDVQQRDKYGRILAYLWDTKGAMINYMMVKDGYAMVYTVPPNVKYVVKLLEAQKIARQEQKGIWSNNGLKQTPSKWRKKHPRT